ncbi:MAG: DUF1214 domain-containing protein [Alphaproteobacteria bacterium]|nr:DUF1214 domain-containing protein [Alphaproteobacteria bacterium]
MRFLLRLLGSLVLAAVLGLGSAYVVARYAMQGDTVVANGPWAGNLAAGGTGADIYTRTSIALTGLLALNKDETIYYNATKDSAGEALDGACTYRIEGRDPDARWWSFTVYGKDHFLIDTPTKRYSISKTSVVRTAEGAFVVRLSTTEEPNNWIATSPDGFQITLRLYNPNASVKDNPATAPLPAIVKEACS